MFFRCTSMLSLFLLVGMAAQDAQAQCDFMLWVDPDGTAYLYNTTGTPDNPNSAATPLTFDGYQIVSETKGLDVAGWLSIPDQIATNAAGIIAALGAGALGFGEAAPTEQQIAELNISGGGTLQPGAKFAIGKPFKSWPDTSAQFFFKLVGAPNNGALDNACIAPEPSSLLLALMGLAAFSLRFGRGRRLVGSTRR